MLLHPISLNELTLKTNIFIAPLAGYTNLPTRQIFRKQGAGIAYAEMVSAEGLNYGFNKSVKLLNSLENDCPLGIQLFGSNAQRILLAFLKIKDLDFQIVDINCGCSVKKILKSNSGAALLKNPDEIYKIVHSLKQNTNKIVTLKIRSGWDHDTTNFLEILDAAQSAGAGLITFHPRYRSMLFSGKADWGQIKTMKEKSKIPVIGNGDIFCGDDAVRMINETLCDGVMLARGLIENPFLVEEVHCALKNISYSPPSLEKRLNTLFEHCESMVLYFGESKGILEFRKYFTGYLKGFPEIKKLRQEVNHLITFNELKDSVLKFFRM